MADLTDAQRLYAWGRSQFESQVAPVVWAGVLAMPLVVERGPGEGQAAAPHHPHTHAPRRTAAFGRPFLSSAARQARG